MHAAYKDYCWKEGKPVGIGKTSEEASVYYRIISDPYQKWISIELYRKGVFAALLYDSRLLDFRKLHAAEQIAWRKELSKKGEAWIYNEDDRLILRESYTESSCEIYSPHGFFLCRYQLLKKVARVILVDSHSHPVLVQQYRTCEGGEFRELLQEERSPSVGRLAAHTLCD